VFNSMLATLNMSWNFFGVLKSDFIQG